MAVMWAIIWNGAVAIAAALFASGWEKKSKNLRSQIVTSKEKVGVAIERTK